MWGEEKNTPTLPKRMDSKKWSRKATFRANKRGLFWHREGKGEKTERKRF